MKIRPGHIGINTLTVISLISLIILVFFANAEADSSDPENWQQIHTENTILYFQTQDDLYRLNTRLNNDLNDQNHEQSVDLRLFPDMAGIVAKKMDALFVRSQGILEMHGFTNKINVKLFKNQQQLSHAFFTLYEKECTVRAWYTHETLTVYIQLDDIHDGMLAHEFAHAIINHYMVIPLPGRSAEILARYVDTHLLADKTGKPGESPVNAYSIR